jgi:hypothetical protein
MKRRDFVRTMCYGGMATFASPIVNCSRPAVTLDLKKRLEEAAAKYCALSPGKI